MNSQKENRQANFTTIIISLGIVFMVFTELSWVSDPKLHVSGIIQSFVNLLLLAKLFSPYEFAVNRSLKRLHTISVFFGLFYAISIVNSAIPSESIFVFLKTANYALFFILISTYSANKLINWNQIGVVITFCFVITLSYISIELFYYKVSPYYVKGTFMNKNITAIFLLLSVPFVIKTLKSPTHFLVRSLLLFTLFYFIFLAFFLHNKAVLLGIFIGIFFYLLVSLEHIKKIKKKYFVYVSIVTLALFTSAIYLAPSSINALIDGTTFKERLLIWENSLQMLFEHPFGVGGGNWQFWFPKYGLDGFFTLNEAIETGVQTIQRPHNDYLWIATEAGIPALLTCFVFIFIIWRNLISARDWHLNITSVAIRIVFLAYLVISFFDFPLERNDIQYIFIIFIVFTLISSPSESIITQSKFPKTIALFIGAMITLSSLTIHAERLSKEYVSTSIIGYDLSTRWENIIDLFENNNFTYYKINNFSIPHEWYVANAYLKIGKLDSAKMHLENAHDKAPFQLCIINSLSSLNLALNNNKEALAITDKGLVISSENRKNLLYRSIALFNLKRYEDAFNCYIQIINRFDNPAPYHKIMPKIFNNYIELEKGRNPIKYSIRSLTNIEVSDSLKEVFLYEIQFHNKTKEYMLNVFDFDLVQN